MTYRAFVQAGGHSNILEYRGAEGRAVSLSGLVGGTASFFVDDALDGQQIFVLAGTGTDYVKQTWDGTDEAGNDVREFKPTIPKISLGVGTLIPTDSGLVFGVGFRREWLFATDAQADDVYAFSASLLSFLVGF
jgi:hypothetical protein